LRRAASEPAPDVPAVSPFGPDDPAAEA